MGTFSQAPKKSITLANSILDFLGIGFLLFVRVFLRFLSQYLYVRLEYRKLGFLPFTVPDISTYHQGNDGIDNHLRGDWKHYITTSWLSSDSQICSLMCRPTIMQPWEAVPGCSFESP